MSLFFLPIAVQTFGELVNFNPHLHVMASSGCFTDNGTFIEGISPNANDLFAPFAKAVLRMLKKEKVISPAVINNMSTWQHSGFNIHCGNPVSFSDAETIERVARYIVRAPISQERLKYIPDNKSDNELQPNLCYFYPKFLLSRHKISDITKSKFLIHLKSARSNRILRELCKLINQIIILKGHKE